MERRSNSLFEAISDFAHNIGIYLTYTLDPRVVSKLTEHATGTITILHDYRQGQNIVFNQNSSIVAIPVKAWGAGDQHCFHSKIILLKNHDSAKIIVSSANLTTTHFIPAEKEIVWEVTIRFEVAEQAAFYHSVVQYLSYLEHLIPVKNEVYHHTLQTLQVHTALAQNPLTCRFIYNDAHHSMFTHIQAFLRDNHLDKPAEKAWIATPFVSDHYGDHAFASLSKECSIYLRKGSRIPVAFHTHKIFQADPKSKRNLFHAKIIVLHFKKKCVVFIGSANFTDQGLLKTTTASGNQECGVVFITEPTAMNDWFRDKYWHPVTDLEHYREDVQNAVERMEASCSYAWAEKQQRTLTVYVFNPQHKNITQTGKKIACEKLPEGFYTTTRLRSSYENEIEVVRFFVGSIEMVIGVFSPAEFNTNTQKKEGLFDLFKGVYSVNPGQMDQVLEGERIKIESEAGIVITEPPRLEQYYQNVKRQVRYISSRQFFTDSNVQEVHHQLHHSADIRILYLALHLQKIFLQKPQCAKLSAICRKRIGELASEHDIDNTQLEKFLKQWLVLNS